MHQPQYGGGYQRRGTHAGKPCYASVRLDAGAQLADGAVTVEGRLDAEVPAQRPGVQGTGKRYGVVGGDIQLSGYGVAYHLPYVYLLQRRNRAVHVFEHCTEFRLEGSLVGAGQQHSGVRFG